MQTRSWREYTDIESMKHGRYAHGCGYSTASNATYVCGGESSTSQDIKQCEVLTSDGSWQLSGIMGISRTARPIVTEIMTPDGPRITVVGGRDTNGNVLKSTEIMELDGEFSAGTSLPVGLAMAAGVALKDSTYIFGGESENGLSARVLKWRIPDTV